MAVARALPELVPEIDPLLVQQRHESPVFAHGDTEKKEEEKKKRYMSHGPHGNTGGVQWMGKYRRVR